VIGMRATALLEACSIRPAQVQEAAVLSNLCFRSKQVWDYDDAFMALCREPLRIKPEEIAAGDVWVAAAPDESIAGIVSLAPGGEPATLDLDKLFIEPNWIRGGVGRLLLAHAVGEARRRGVTRLTILADPNAAAFYERSGARFIRMAPSDAVPGRFVPLYEIVL
jgi:GNAT superfamily N-acetyltransferase